MKRREFVAGIFAVAFAPPAPRVILKVLGSAQDGGYPQVGTYDPRNDRARRNRTLARKVASLAILNAAERRCYLVDATPDLPAQLDLLRQTTFLKHRLSRDLIDGILLTHAHMGHYTGLMFLGLEAMDARRVPVHCTRRMAEFLSHNGPWDLLLKRNEIEINAFEPDKEVRLDSLVGFQALKVPHRDEYSDTVGFVIRGSQKKVLYLPDVDTWNSSLTEAVRGVDAAFLDGTFFNSHEMPGVDMSRFPHPRIADTMEELKGLSTVIYFTHLNNSNPATDPKSEAARRILSKGFKIAEDGLEFPI